MHHDGIHNMARDYENKINYSSSRFSTMGKIAITNKKKFYVKLAHQRTATFPLVTSLRSSNNVCSLMKPFSYNLHVQLWHSHFVITKQTRRSVG